MAAETYEIVHASWLKTRTQVKALQGEHHRCLNEKGEQTEDIEQRRADLEESFEEQRAAFEEHAITEAVDLNKRIATLEHDYAIATKRLRTQHTRLQELLSEELKRDKGAMAAGLNDGHVRHPVLVGDSD